jgi:hypothetical protein
MSRRSKLPLFDADLEVKAQAFHAANPHVYVQLRALAVEAQRAGRTRIGIAALFERLRATTETHGDRYRLNNSYRGWYARRLMKTEPELAGLFETREAAFDETYHDRPTRGAA